MNVIPWYIYAFLTMPFFLMGVVVGVVVANLSGVRRPLIAIAGAFGAVSGEWLGVLGLRRFAASIWPPAFVGALLGSCVLTLAAAWLIKRRQ